MGGRDGGSYTDLFIVGTGLSVPDCLLAITIFSKVRVSKKAAPGGRLVCIRTPTFEKRSQAASHQPARARHSDGTYVDLLIAASFRT